MFSVISTSMLGDFLAEMRPQTPQNAVVLHFILLIYTGTVLRINSELFDYSAASGAVFLTKQKINQPFFRVSPWQAFILLMYVLAVCNSRCGGSWMVSAFWWISCTPLQRGR